MTRSCARNAQLLVAGWLAGCCVWAVTTLDATPALAQTQQPVALRWSAPADCPEQADVSAEVERILSSSGCPQPSEPLRASVQVTRDGNRYRARLEIESDAGTSTREIHSSSCQAVADATALVLALVIDPDAKAPTPATASARPTAPAPTKKPEPPARTARAPRQPQPPARPRSPQRALELHALAWAGGDLGSLPAPSAMFGAGFGVQLGAQTLELDGAFWPERFGAVGSGSSTGGNFSLLAGSLRTCRLLLRGRLGLGPCVAFELGRLHARGVGVDQPGQASELWSDAAIGAELVDAPFGPLTLTLRLDAAFPLLRPRFVLTHVGPVYRPAPVVGRALFGVGGRF